MPNYFVDMMNRAVAQGIQTAKIEAARNWFSSQTTNVRRVEPRTVIQKSRNDLMSRVFVGKMFLFMYEAKTKETLPYFDRFPLIFPFRKVNDGFYGINMHYLPYMLRAKLMDALYETLNNDKKDETTRLRITYNILSSAARFRYFEPCIKRYLNNQVQSRFLYVDPNQWETALFLPLERFVGATKQQVWKDSRKKIGI
ncbi:hypothetical protein EB118_02950 [bacterium]|nr:hypothetical protein [bacterium]